MMKVYYCYYFKSKTERPAGRPVLDATVGPASSLNTTRVCVLRRFGHIYYIASMIRSSDGQH